MAWQRKHNSPCVNLKVFRVSSNWYVFKPEHVCNKMCAPMKCHQEIAFCCLKSLYLPVSILFLLLYSFAFPLCLLCYSYNRWNLITPWGIGAAGHAAACLGRLDGGGDWIKGPPVLHRMINDLQISGGQLFDRPAVYWRTARKPKTAACPHVWKGRKRRKHQEHRHGKPQ